MSISSIVIFPIKGCRGVSLTSTTICAQGLLHDHNFMLVARPRPEAPYETIDLKSCPQLAFIQPSIDASRLRIEHAPTKEFIFVDLEPDRTQYKLLPDTVMLWKCPHRPLDLGDTAASFFSRFIPGDVRLCYKGQTRLISGNLPPRTAQNGKQVEASLHAAFPLLIGSQASLDDLNGRIPEDDEIDMEQFRVNIILDGFDAWEEDRWSKIEIGGQVIIHVVARCWRCPITQVNLTTAKLSPQPLRELRKYRQIDTGVPLGSPVFGMYGVFDSLEGTLKVGDSVNVLEETSNHKFIMPQY